MGKTKTKIIDDSISEDSKESKSQKSQKKKEAKPDDVILGSEATPESSEISEDQEANSGQTRMTEPNAEILKQVLQATSPQHRDDTKKEEPKKSAKEKTSKRAAKKGNLKYRSKKYLEKREEIERNKFYPIVEAVDKAKGASYSKFAGTLEVHINTNQQNLRGLVSLPFATGKKLKILAFGPSKSSLRGDSVEPVQVKALEDMGATIGTEETISQILKGKVDFDVIVTTSEWMPKLAKTAAILGPRGLMPNPKSGTITEDLKKAVSELQTGKIEYKSEKQANVMHLGIGKLNQPTEELSQNLTVLLTTIGKSRIKKVSLAPSMGPSVKVDISSI